tara:strand:+ start:198 stop:377 length:180 start_codon:yes stop_codon:yes gene_type:complete
MTHDAKNQNDNLSKSGDEFAKDPLKDKIGTNLRQLYNTVVDEPVPDDFLALLEQADKGK